MRAITEQSGGLFFIDAPGSTGKTFLLSLILATIRSQNNIALAIASSGIAATLLNGGRTTHSALKLPLNLQNPEAPTCNISKNSGMGKVLQTCQIIIWDECTMSHKKALEALDRTLRDFRGNRRIFGGALILLSGDFRQTLPIIPRSTLADELRACLKSSILWRHLQKLTLKTNMRVQLQRDASAGNFAKQLMDIEMGEWKLMNLHNVSSCQQNFSAKNIDVNTINFTIQHGIPSETTTYKSIDTVENQDEVVNYPTEFLNSLDLPGMPPHVLTLKIGVPIIFLRNINPPRLCNGTRLSVKKMMNNVIEATILTGKFKGEDVLLPRIPMIPTDMPFEFKRLQFPVRLAFAMTINKAQGQSLQVCGLNLENPCFSHGQLYVACSHVGKPSDLFVYAPDGKTRNIVYPTALQ
ncbi:ATP-dependent DNA helicase [Trichonephila clavipes]|nr:ATP-dependent DNA helicase [Trichonephila clavipes]